MLFGFVERQSQLTVARCRNQAGTAIAQVVVVIVIWRDIVIIMIFRWTPAVLRADCTPCWWRMFQLFMRLVQMLGVIDGRCVAYQMIVVDNAVDVENLRIVKARLLVIVHCVQVVRVLTLRERDNAVARLARSWLRIEWIVGWWDAVGARQWIFPWDGLLFVWKGETKKMRTWLINFQFQFTA